MVVYTDTFATLDTAPVFPPIITINWMKVLLAGDIILVPTQELVQSTGAGNYLVHSESSTYTTVISPNPILGPTPVTLPAAHGFATGDIFQVVIINDGHAPFNATYTATATGPTTFTVPFDNDPKVTTDTGAAIFSRQLTGTQQEVEVSIFSTAQTASSFATIWARLDRSAAFALVRAGYGMNLAWNADGTRTLSIVKVGPGTGVAEVLATGTVTLASRTDTDGVAASTDDLGVVQWMRLIVFDRNDPTDLPEQSRVVVRAYLNEADDGLPTMEVEDSGRSDTGISQTVHRAAGTWAITFGAVSTIQYDAFAGRDTYVVPDFGVHRPAFATLATLRTTVNDEISFGGLTGYAAARIDRRLNKAVQQVINSLGDRAFFMERFKELTVSANATTRIVTLPHDIKRIVTVYDAQTQEPIAWRELARDDLGRILGYMEPVPTARALVFHYIQAFEPMSLDTDLCPIPIEHDEVVTEGAVRRIAEKEGETSLMNGADRRYAESLEELKQAMGNISRTRQPAIRITNTRRQRGTRYDFSHLRNVSYTH